MAVGFSSYEIARSGLSASERGLYVTGHNLSNVNTPGYVRQQAMFETSPYITEFGKNGLFQYGLGADVQEVRQIRHTFLDTVYRNESKSLGYWETRSKTYQDVQAILGDPMSVGMQGVMNQFWDSWQELSKEPESLTTRALVRQRAQSLADQMNHMGKQLEKLQTDLNSEIRVKIGEVNEITGQIAILNKAIMTQESSGDNANDYRDQRNLLLDNLSRLCDIDATEMQDGQVNITLGGYSLVSKGTSKNLYVEANAKNGQYFKPMLEGTKTEIPIKSGTLKGLLESRGEVPGIKGGYENGSPRDKVDITIGIDTSQGSGVGATEYLSKMKASIDKYVKDIKLSGLDFNIRFVAMNEKSSVHGDAVYNLDNIDDFLKSGIDTLFSATTAPDASFDGFIDKLEEIRKVDGFRKDATKFAVVFTNESIDGNSGAAVTDPSGYIDRLNNLGMKTSIVGDSKYNTEGEDASEAGWNKIAVGTGGKTYDINATPEKFSALLVSINRDINKTANGVMGNIPQSNNIVSDLKIKLNTMVNAMVREINYLHSGGVTLDGKQGGNLFEAIDDRYSMQMGNIKLSDSILSDKGLNNIIASKSGAIGDNTVAREIANLRDKDILTEKNGEVSLDEYYSYIILDVGNNGQESYRTSINQQQMVKSADEQRTSISGVSMDEEMSNMMKFKFAYDASSRTLNIIDEMIQTIITQMGVVGR